MLSAGLARFQGNAGGREVVTRRLPHAYIHLISYNNSIAMFFYRCNPTRPLVSAFQPFKTDDIHKVDATPQGRTFVQIRRTLAGNLTRPTTPHPEPIQPRSICQSPSYLN